MCSRKSGRGRETPRHTRGRARAHARGGKSDGQTGAMAPRLDIKLCICAINRTANKTLTQKNTHLQFPAASGRQQQRGFWRHRFTPPAARSAAGGGAGGWGVVAARLCCARGVKPERKRSLRTVVMEAWTWEPLPTTPSIHKVFTCCPSNSLGVAFVFHFSIQNVS